MPTYLANTFWVVVGTVILALLFSVPSAWIMAMCKVPSEKILQWALVLPLAMPGYIVGYIYTDWFDYAGLFRSFYEISLVGKPRLNIGFQIFALLVGRVLF